MIDEKKLIEYINNMSDECNLFRWKSAKKIKEGFRNIIQRQPQIGGWIPCSERLPEKTTGNDGIKHPIVLAFAGTEDDWMVYLAVYDFFGDKEWTNTDDPMKKISGIIAWQSLPKAYKPK